MEFLGQCELDRDTHLDANGSTNLPYFRISVRNYSRFACMLISLIYKILGFLSNFPPISPFFSLRPPSPFICLRPFLLFPPGHGPKYPNKGQQVGGTWAFIGAFWGLRKDILGVNRIEICVNALTSLHFSVLLS